MLGPSVLTMNNNVFCIERGTSTWQNQQSFRVSNEGTILDYQEAYIYAQNKATTSSGYSQSLLHGSVPQNAIWSVLGQGTYTYNNSVKTLINEASAFKTYKDDLKSNGQIQSLTNVDKITANKLDNGNVVVGPLKVRYSQVKGLTYIPNSYNKSGITKIKVEGIKNGSKAELTAGTDYYLSSDDKGKINK